MARPTARPDTDRPPEPTELREVRVEDPHLSAAANVRLTEELTETLGTDRVRVPAGRPHPSRGETVPDGGIARRLSDHRLFVIRTFLFALVLGGVLALLTGSWWLLPLVAGLHAVGTTVIAGLAIGMTTTRERPGPTTVAALAEEGVRDPEHHFSVLIDEFSPAEAEGTPRSDAAGAGDVVTPGHNTRTTEAIDDPVRAGAEQTGAMTPSSGPSEPAGAGGVPDAILWGIFVGLAVVSIVIPAAFGGGALWLVTAIMLPLLAIWVILQARSAAHSDQ